MSASPPPRIEFIVMLLFPRALARFRLFVFRGYRFIASQPQFKASFSKVILILFLQVECCILKTQVIYLLNYRE